MPILEINLPAKEIRVAKYDLYRQQIRDAMRREDAEYNVENSRLGVLIRTAMPACATSIIGKLQNVYETRTTPHQREQFRRANNVNAAFTWAETQEGSAYWSNINRRTIDAQRLLYGAVHG